ncbi:urease accessory protein [Alteromonadaceae bacterium Bs31]|nr:urease accessory protein [Alteromonadaceae bacterium Bs31]
MSNAVPEILASTPEHTREWSAAINLHLALRDGKTRVVKSQHHGPLRIQRPFYPEESCHLYLLHPPGGMVIGDELQISAELLPHAQALITTPSAGKIYGAKGADFLQQQNVQFKIASGACLEWLPQETIVFDSANGVLNTRIELEHGASYGGWDIVRLGRLASGETFSTGRCIQKLEIWQGERPLFIERNSIEAGGDLHKGLWGLQGKSTFGTLLLTAVLQRDAIDDLVNELESLDLQQKECWGLTQKGPLFIARYLGDDIALCRKGFELIWKAARPALNNREAVSPRIWNT